MRKTMLGIGFVLAAATTTNALAAHVRGVVTSDVFTRLASARDVRAQALPVLAQAASFPGVELGGTLFPQSVASGDPRPDSVVLWTRVDDPSWAGADVPVRVIVTQDPFFQHVVYNQVVTAKADYDHCLKVKVSGLAPRTSYLYFFVVDKGGTLYLSRLGHTKTAPAANDTAPVRFAFFSCQDYEGNYYNTYAKLLLDHASDIDFVMFLGDYIYETTGDPSFQHPTPARRIDFTDKAGAIQLGDAANPYWAAASLSNYRQLYATYRSDPMLQQLHESFPMVAIWDDHEYSNDCHGDVATYFNKRKDEADPTRRRNSERAFFEYMPITAGLGADGTLSIDDSILYPNARIYQDLRFGANLDLVLTDYRSFRPDVVVREDAFPGAIVMDEPTLQAVLTPAVYSAVKGSFDPYIAIDQHPDLQGAATMILTALYAQENPFLTQAGALAAAQQAATGNFSVTYLNALFAGAGLPAPIPDAAIAALPRGLSNLFVGKQSLYSDRGSRYVLARDTFDLLAGYLYAVTSGASEDAFGQTQEAWIRQTLSTSQATWKVLTSSVSMTPMFLDFTNPTIAAMLPPTFPAAYRTRLLVDADEWDGFPDRRKAMLDFLAGIPNAVVVSGDIHASFVADHGHGVYEFTGPAVSSQTLRGEISQLVGSDPVLSQVEGIDQLIGAVGDILKLSASDPSVSPSHIVYDHQDVHGCVLVEAGPNALTATYYEIDAAQVGNDYYADPAQLDSLFHTVTFKVSGGALSQVGD